MESNPLKSEELLKDNQIKIGAICMDLNQGFHITSTQQKNRLERRELGICPERLFATHKNPPNNFERGIYVKIIRCQQVD